MRIFYLLLALYPLPLALWANGTSLSEVAMIQTTQTFLYDGSYQQIAYPMGDVPIERGVCTDVIIRAYRELGTDLQVLVHEDMRKYFDQYPKIWGLKTTNTNIDHRRVPNLKVFFKRHGTVLPVSKNPEDYKPGSLVTWVLPGNLPHIGIVSSFRTKDGQRPMIIHNVGQGTVLEDFLFAYPITGHYLYKPEPNT